MLRSRLLVVSGVAGAFIALFLGYALLTSDRSSSLTIASGPKNGPSWPIAQEIAAALRNVGYEAEVISNEESLVLIGQVDDPKDTVDISFLYNAVDARQYPLVNTLGTIGNRPIVLVALDPATPTTGLIELRGLRIDVGPSGSAQAELVTAVLATYGVTARNSTLLNMPSNSTLAQYQAADVDVASERLGDERDIPALADRGLRLIPIRENQAVAGFVPSAQAITIPRGGLSLDPVTPQAPLPTVGQMLTVIAREDLNPAAVYAVAESLTQAFGDSTVYSSAGEFPNFADRQLPINPYVADFYNTGQVPWQYRHLPPILAGSLLKLVIPLSLLVLFSSLYSILLPELYSLWTGVVRPRSQERLVSAMETRLAQGQELTVRERQQLSEILSRQDAGRAMRERVEALRQQLSEPVEPTIQHPPGAPASE